MTFGQRLKFFRQKTGLSGRAFAATVGMDSGNYCKLETDTLAPGVEIIERLASALECNDIERALLHALGSKHRILKFIQRECP